MLQKYISIFVMAFITIPLWSQQPDYLIEPALETDSTPILNHPPYFTSEPNTYAYDDYAYLYKITASDPDFDSLKIGVIEKPVWIGFINYQNDSALLYGVPSSPENVVKLFVTDFKDTTYQEFSINITCMNCCDLIVPDPVTTIMAGNGYHYDVWLNNTMKKLSMTSDNLPDWLNISDHGFTQATLSGSPTNANTGKYEISLLLRAESEICPYQTRVKYVLTVLPSSDDNDSSEDHYWGTHGAKWYYEQEQFDPRPSFPYNMFTSLGETTIHGDRVSIIEEKAVGINDQEWIYDTTYMKYDNNRVFYYHEPSERFMLMYDFNAESGDTVEVFCRQTYTTHCDSFILIKIDSVSSTVIGGDTLKVQYFSNIFTENSCCAFNENLPIIERIGHLHFMFPQHSWADPPHGGKLRCYEDTIIGLYKQTEYACDTVIVLKNKSVSKNQISIYPNPVYHNSEIFINGFDHKSPTYEIIDIYGRIRQKGILKNVNSIKLNEKSVSSGIYLIRLIQGPDLIYNGRIIVH